MNNFLPHSEKFQNKEFKRIENSEDGELVVFVNIPPDKRVMLLDLLCLDFLFEPAKISNIFV